MIVERCSVFVKQGALFEVFYAVDSPHPLG
jgi:hypothetical protein